MANIIREGVLDSDPINRDLKNFLWRVHKELKYSVPSAMQYDMCDYIQQARPVDDQGAREILMGFRGVAKSHVTTCAATWKLRRDRAKRVLVTSATGRFAGLISTFAWQMVNNFDWLADMKPRTDQRRSAIGFDVGGAPAANQHESFASVPITGQLPGRRATDIIGDDLETPNTSDTEGARTELLQRVSELGGAIILPGGDIHFLGTAQTEDTLYLKLEERGYHIRIYPVLYPHIPSGNKEVDKTRVTTERYGPRLAPFILNRLEANPALAGTSTNPERFTELDIMARKREWGVIEFDRQFLMLLDAGQGRGNPLKLRDIPVMELPVPTLSMPHYLLPSEVQFSPLPVHKLDIQVDAMTGDSQVYAPSKVDIMVPAEEIICFVDPSGGGSDETTWTILGGLLGRVYLLYQGASTDGHSKEVLEQIAKDCKLWRVLTVLVESNFGQGMFGELLGPKFLDIQHPVNIEEARVGKVSKEARIVSTLEPLITDQRLIMRAEVLRRDFTESIAYEHVEAAKRKYHRLTYQLTRITKQKGALKHDDRVDGLAGGAAHFIGVLQRRIAEAAQAGRVQAHDIEVEKMVAARVAQGLPTFGYQDKGPTLGKPTRRPKK